MEERNDIIQLKPSEEASGLQKRSHRMAVEAGENRTGHHDNLGAASEHVNLHDGPGKQEELQYRVWNSN